MAAASPLVLALLLAAAASLVAAKPPEEKGTPPVGISPCSAYNSFHSDGNVNCLECTSIQFSASSVTDKNFLWVTTRAGTRFPMKRFVAPTRAVGGDDTRYCMWCPERQQCGHPLDTESRCPSRITSGDNFDSNAGFVPHKACYNSESTPPPARPCERALSSRADKQNVNKYRQEAERVEQERRKRLTPEEQRKADDILPKAVKDPVEIPSRETMWLSERESRLECLGECRQNGGRRAARITSCVRVVAN